MRIFSNFDTRLKKNSVEKYQKIYGIDKVLLLSKSKLFWFIKIFIPIFFYLLILVGAIRLAYIIFDSDKHAIYAGIIVFVLLLIISGPIIKHYMDYKMDFAIVTPESLIMFNQTGIFKRDTAEIDMDKIKTISIKKRTILYSIFDNGNVIFLSEGDNNNYGEIILVFISNPEDKRDKINGIIDNFNEEENK